jgi:hypothetical protein
MERVEEAEEEQLHGEAERHEEFKSQADDPQV